MRPCSTLAKIEAHGGADASTITEIASDELTGTLGLSGARSLVASNQRRSHQGRPQHNPARLVATHH